MDKQNQPQRIADGGACTSNKPTTAKKQSGMGLAVERLTDNLNILEAAISDLGTRLHTLIIHRPYDKEETPLNEHMAELPCFIDKQAERIGGLINTLQRIHSDLDL